MKTVAISILFFLGLEALVFIKEAIHTAFLSITFGQYVKAHHYSLWCDLTSLGVIGPGIANPFKSLPWLFRDITSADEHLLRLKDKVRRHARWFIVSGLALLTTLVTSFLGFLVYGLFGGHG